MKNIYLSKWEHVKGFKVLSLGDAGLRIESLTIRIPSRPNLIVDFHPIWNPTTKLYHRSRFWSNFDLFSITIDYFGLKDRKIRLKDWNRQLKDRKSLLISKKSITFNLFLISLDTNQLFWYSPDIIKSISLQRLIWITRIWIEKVY